MKICPHCKAPAPFLKVFSSTSYTCSRCERPLEYRVRSQKLYGVFCMVVVGVALRLTRSLGWAWSMAVGVMAGAISGLVGSYLLGRLEPIPSPDEKPSV